MAETKENVQANESEQEFSGRPLCLKDFDILKHIIYTEESQRLRDEENAMVFAVSKKATKLEIKAAVEALFGAKVSSVNTMNPQAKTRRVGRYSGKLPAYKKAIVRFDSSYDLGKIADTVASEERQANQESDEK